MSKLKEEILQTVRNALVQHDFTFKVLVLATLNILLPLVWPLIGVSALMLINIYTSYQANKRLKVKCKAKKSAGKYFAKWFEFIIGVISTTIMDLLARKYLGTNFNYFTAIYIVYTALKEMKSISQNFLGLSLSKALKVFMKFMTTKGALYEMIDEEIKSNEKENNETN